MKAAVYYGAGDIRVEERPEPIRTEDNLVARVTCCAICGTDLKLSIVGNPRCHPPRIIGHEFAGVIDHAGKAVNGFKPGDRITMATTIACGNCAYCNRGLGNLCPNAKPISYDFDGAFAEFIAIPPEAIAGGNVIKVPDALSDDAAALAEPLSCALNAQEIAGVKAGDAVLILGGGPLGALHAELAKALGAKEVMLVELSEKRLQLLRKLRGITLIDGKKENVLSVVKGRTGGLGADAVIVCAPARQAQEEAICLARKAGTIVFFASLPKDASEITLDSRIIHYGELRLAGSSDSRPEHVFKVVRLMAEGKIETAAVITHRVPLEKILDGIGLMKKQESLKVLVIP